MKMISIEKELKENSYPGRGIVIGRIPKTEKRQQLLILLWEEVRKQPQPYFCGRRGRHPYTGI